jgi:hypothetical protein
MEQVAVLTISAMIQLDLFVLQVNSNVCVRNFITGTPVQRHVVSRMINLVDVNIIS